jgi:endonuclease/exonuclease/phosphatase (EEP) superfamily protein YafD
MAFPIVGVLWALPGKRWKIVASQIITLLFAIFILCRFQIPNHASTHKGSHVRIVTWNVLRAGSGSSATRIAQSLKQQKVDIICLQETRGPNEAKFRKALRREFSGWNLTFAGDVMTLSRFPLIQQKKHAAPAPSKRFVLDTTFRIGEKQLRVLNAHWTTSPLLSELKKQWPGGSSKMRSVQASQLLKLTQNSTTPFLVAGDFNNPPRGRIYNRLAQQWQDAFAVRGFGLGGTYPARYPLLRIDYIWTSRDIRVLNCQTVKSHLSDHRALVADIQL